MKPILFSTPMVQAVMKGTKTQTRRKTNLNKINENPDDWTPIEFNNGYQESDGGWALVFRNNKTGEEIRIKSPYGYWGDILWVRETWQKKCSAEGENNGFWYKADEDQYLLPWKPSIFMPKEACRTFLGIIHISAERLHDISDDDIMKEGITYDGQSGYYFAGDSIMASSVTDAWMKLWISINGEESWNNNPWLWVVNFQKLEDYEGFTESNR